MNTPGRVILLYTINTTTNTTTSTTTNTNTTPTYTTTINTTSTIPFTTYTTHQLHDLGLQLPLVLPSTVLHPAGDLDQLRSVEARRDETTLYLILYKKQILVTR